MVVDIENIEFIYATGRWRSPTTPSASELRNADGNAQ